MSRWKILVTAQAFAVSGQAAHKLLIDGGHTVVVASKFGPLTLESLIAEAHDCDAIIAATDPYDHLTFAALPSSSWWLDAVWESTASTCSRQPKLGCW